MKAVKTLLAIVTFSAVASAATVSFATTAGSKNGSGDPISATADVTPNANGTITVVLKDLLASPGSVGQLLSDFSFTIGVSSALNTTTTPTGSLIIVNDNGSTSASADAMASWGLTSSGFVIHLDSLTGGPSQTIIGPGPYTTANSSIKNTNGPHNPFIDGTATFNFAVAGVGTGTTISNGVFSFGTASGDNVTGCLVGGPQCTSTNLPEPISSALVGTGLVSLFFLRRRAIRKA